MNDADLERLFREHNAHLVRYLTRRLGDRDWAEEVAQETFLRALRQDSITNERAWLFTVANNLVRDDARRDARRRKHLTLLQAEERERETAEPEPTSLERAQEAALLMSATGMPDVVDALVAVEALRRVPSIVITSDPSDIRALLDADERGRRVAVWPV